MIGTMIIKLFDFRIILLFKGIKIIQEKNVLLNKIGRFRKKIFLEQKYIEEKEIPEVWLDDYDKEAINICATKGGEIISAIRLIPKSSLPLPIERYFNLTGSLPERTVEISKLAVLKKYRGGSRLLFLTLVQRAYSIAKSKGISNFVMFMPDWLGNSVSKMGIRIETIGHNQVSEKELVQRNEMRNYFERQTIIPYIIQVEQ